MGHRLTRIYTRTGDTGDTGLGDGTRLPKDHPRIEAIGTVDELNAAIGLLLTHALPTPVREALTTVQHRLFDIGGELSLPGYRPAFKAFPARHTSDLERFLDELNSRLPPLREFILPGGPPPAAACHLARTICRRAERRLVALQHTEEINPHILGYINRLSDLLFVLARSLTREQGRTETQWHSPRGQE